MEHAAEVVVAVTEVVLEVIALVFEGVGKVSFSTFQRARAPRIRAMRLPSPMVKSVTQEKRGDLAVRGVLPVPEEIDLKVEAGLAQPVRRRDSGNGDVPPWRR